MIGTYSSPQYFFIDVIPCQSKSKHLCGIHESDSKTVNTKELTLFCVLWETQKEKGGGGGSELFRAGYNTETNIKAVEKNRKCRHMHWGIY